MAARRNSADELRILEAQLDRMRGMLAVVVTAECLTGGYPRCLTGSSSSMLYAQDEDPRPAKLAKTNMVSTMTRKMCVFVRRSYGYKKD
jgi:hypothetical protein